MDTSPKKILTLPLRIALAILIVGSLLKIMHWPNGNLVMNIGFATIFILYPIRFWKKDLKTLIDWIKLGLALCWALNGILTIEKLPVKNILSNITLGLFMTWVLLEGISYLKKGGNARF